VYITKDGVSLFLSQPVDTTEEIEIPTVQPAQQDIPKSDKPEVELFVMSYCPYGTQAEKGIIPAVRALGGNIDFKVRFVYYAMHGEKEVTEQTRQYCIQEEQNDKLLDYLACFLGDGESEPCLTEANIDTAKLDLCVEAADSEFEITANLEDEEKWLNGRYPKFNTDADLNSEYGVSGSPTLVINGNKVSSSRDSASYLATICSAFNEAPEACSEELSSATPSAGFGYSEGVATDAQC
jgi:glutaredoxin